MTPIIIVGIQNKGLAKSAALNPPWIAVALPVAIAYKLTALAIKK